MFHVKQSNQLAIFASLVRRYHHALDLMSPTAVEAIETKLAESRAYAALISPYLSPTEQILDIGSGSGLPGIVLALEFPGTPIVLVERRRKRASFLQIVVSQLGLEQVQVIHADARRLSVSEIGTVNWVTAQAVGSFGLLYTLSQHLLAPSFTLVARRASNPAPIVRAELEELKHLVERPFTELSVPLPTHGRVLGLRFAASDKEYVPAS